MSTKNTTLLIARHGNTFTSEQTPTRVGCRTDLPLVESGREQARKLGTYLKTHSLSPNHIYTSTLKRTIEMGCITEEVIGHSIPQDCLDIFNEIDYGPDENMPESAVLQRLGEESIHDWNEKAIVPDGWIVNTQDMIKNWIDFGHKCTKQFQGQTVLAITSNGVARFAPHLAGDFDSFQHDLKISTGALCILEHVHSDNRWYIKDWNIRP